MSIELKLLKGTNDFLPKMQLLRSRMVKSLTKVFELYSYLPLETPILEYYDILSSKYAGGAEILKETYKLTDQGKRELALRYDLTVPLSRVIGMNPHLKMPFKRYEIGKVFRDGPIKLGRYREFTQCDVDIVGVKSMQAEAELIALAYDIFKKLNLEDIRFEINNRKLLAGILLECGFSTNQLSEVIISIDKLKKIGEESVEAELIEKGINKELIKKVFELIAISGSNSEIINKLENFLTNSLALEGLNELKELIRLIPFFNVPKEKIIFLPSLARGLEIYTGTVFEVFSNVGTIKSSLAAGGRYDKIIGKFLNSKKEFPAVGISFGLEPIFESIKSQLETMSTDDRIFVISIKSDEVAINMTSKLRKANIKTEFDFRQKGITKSLNYANTEGFNWVIIIGPKEVKTEKYTLKNMITGEEENLPIQDIIDKVQSKYKV